MAHGLYPSLEVFSAQLPYSEIFLFSTVTDGRTMTMDNNNNNNNKTNENRSSVGVILTPFLLL